ncbi:S1 domain-containing protein [Desulfonatronum thiodismutans]|uniref:hypothetical protein n=1 Tax=Desulfonatronum thiodismutans TaxID=159290 RepID=UPI003898EDF0
MRWLARLRRLRPSRLVNEHQVLAQMSKKMRMRFIRFLINDKVRMNMSPHDLNRDRITYRLK